MSKRIGHFVLGCLCRLKAAKSSIYTFVNSCHSDESRWEVFWSNFGTQLGFGCPHYLRFVPRREVGLRKPDRGAAMEKMTIYDQPNQGEAEKQPD